MTDYNKWAKLAAEINSSDDSSDLKIEDREEFVEYIHLPPKPFDTKAELMKMMEPLPDFGKLLKADDDGKSMSEEMGWSYMGQGTVVGYSVNDEKMYRCYFDDNFLAKQTQFNLAGRTLMCCEAKGSFVVWARSATTRGPAKITKKEIADLIMRRINGKDRDKLVEHNKSAAEKLEFAKKMGMTVIGVDDKKL